MMGLYVDVGNQRIKWASEACLQADKFEALSHAETGWEQKLFAAWREMESPECVVLSNVAPPKVVQAIEKVCLAAWGVSVQHAQASSQTRHLSIQYSPIESLGVDRFLAMHGALAKHRDCCSALLVVNVGTAMTIDFMLAKRKKWEFLGGVIMPGFAVLKSAIYSNTAKIESFDHEVDWLLGLQNLSSQDCVYGGLVNMLFYALEGSVNDYLKRYPNLCIVMAGGDAKALMPRLKANLNLQDNRIQYDAVLVMRGMKHLYGIS